MKNKLSYNFISIKYHSKCEDFPKGTKCNWTFLEQRKDTIKLSKLVKNYFYLKPFNCSTSALLHGHNDDTWYQRYKTKKSVINEKCLKKNFQNFLWLFRQGLGTILEFC